MVTATHQTKDFSFAIYADGILALLGERHQVATSGPPITEQKADQGG